MMQYRKLSRKILLSLLTLPVFFFIFFPSFAVQCQPHTSGIVLCTHSLIPHPHFKIHRYFLPSQGASSVPRTFAGFVEFHQIIT
jgi:hypothetical protein